ncbi:hypothetical protein CR513_33384, partial [Mucuna pruriens]
MENNFFSSTSNQGVAKKQSTLHANSKSHATNFVISNHIGFHTSSNISNGVILNLWIMDICSKNHIIPS